MTRTGRKRKYVPFVESDALDAARSQKHEPPVNHGDPLKKALVGRRVRTLRILKNALCMMPIGSTLTIVATHRGRFSLRGHDYHEILTGVPMDAFEVLD